MWKILSEHILKKIPRLYETEGDKVKEKMIYLHFFVAGSDWYIAEFDGEDTFFGFACLNRWKDLAEWGYISYKELKGLRVEQPIIFNGKPEVIFLQVECKADWKVKKAKDSQLIRECQGW